MKKILASGLVILATSSVVQAESWDSGGWGAEEWYAGLQYSYIEANVKFNRQEDCCLNGSNVLLDGEIDSKPSAINLNVGKTINENFAIEGLLGFGLSDDDANGTLEDGFSDSLVRYSDAKLGLKTLLGVSAVGKFPINDSINAYGKLGLAQIKYEDEDNDTA
ncbi:MAG: outer membrane beta-barrel protein, partial [Gammaproteobacteria bacterium]